MTERTAVPAAVRDLVRGARRVVVLTGAGMSAESGVPTFRDPGTGLWSRYDPMDLATPQAWARDRELVWGWYLGRVAAVRAAQPNAGHIALARWAGEKDVTVVTQNVDDLHERAGSRDVIHLHGRLEAFRCDRCAAAYDAVVEVGDAPAERAAPPRCARGDGWVRPGVVWFGEPLPADDFGAALDVVERADVVLVVGTSGIVHPAAGLPGVAREAGAVVIEVNPVRTEISRVAHHEVRGTAAEVLPAL